jgi:asparagine synthase (glutamine-hydrolysing)
VLLSGGLDSSLVASVAARIMKDKNPNYDVKTLHSFCVGLEGSPDIAAAQKAADFIGTDHHSYTYTMQEGLDAIKEVIYHVETYDTTTIRASTPMFLMSRKIKARGIKMVLSGEGADEIFAGYLYFHKAPSAGELQAELRDKIANLHLFDCLRANKSTSAWGLEPRVPFLDVDLLDVAMNIDPEEKMIKDGRIEKHILRFAFDTPENPYLPKDILWRQKEQFSDGVGYGWIDSLRELAAANVTDVMFGNAKNRFIENPPTVSFYYTYLLPFSLSNPLFLFFFFRRPRRPITTAPSSKTSSRSPPRRSPCLAVPPSPAPPRAPSSGTSPSRTARTARAGPCLACTTAPTTPSSTWPQTTRKSSRRPRRRESKRSSYRACR